MLKIPLSFYASYPLAVTETKRIDQCAWRTKAQHAGCCAVRRCLNLCPFRPGKPAPRDL